MGQMRLIVTLRNEHNTRRFTAHEDLPLAKVSEVAGEMAAELAASMRASERRGKAQAAAAGESN